MEYLWSVFDWSYTHLLTLFTLIGMRKWENTAIFLTISFWIFALWVLKSLFWRIFGTRTSYSLKHVVITGGSEGLGLATAKEFFKRNAHVTILSRSKAKLEAALLEIEEYRQSDAQRLHSASCDVSDFKSVKKQIESCEMSVGPIDVLLTCVGMSRPGYFADLKVENFETEIQVNYMGAVHAAKAVMPFFLERQRGHLIFTTSTLALMGMPGYSSYCASKWAIRGLVMCLWSELRMYKDIQVSICYPPTMDTPGLKVENESKPQLTWEIEQIGNDIFTPEEVAIDYVDKISRGDFAVSYDAFSQMERVVGANLEPRNDYFFEILFLPLWAIINAVCVYAMRLKVHLYMKRERKEQ